MTLIWWYSCLWGLIFGKAESSHGRGFSLECQASNRIAEEFQSLIEMVATVAVVREGVILMTGIPTVDEMREQGSAILRVCGGNGRLFCTRQARY